MHNIKTIRWKKVMGGYEGIHQGEILFSIQGGLCITDLRPCKGVEWKSPEHYRIKDREDAKRIAKDLLNERNLEEHHANRDAMEAESMRSALVIQDAQAFLDKLKKGEL